MNMKRNTLIFALSAALFLSMGSSSTARASTDTSPAAASEESSSDRPDNSKMNENRIMGEVISISVSGVTIKDQEGNEAEYKFTDSTSFTKISGMRHGQSANSEQPTFADGEQPTFAEGEQPALPDGETFAEGEQPSMPDGDMSAPADGEMPANGETLAEGEQPSISDQAGSDSSRKPGGVGRAMQGEEIGLKEITEGSTVMIILDDDGAVSSISMMVEDEAAAEESAAETSTADTPAETSAPKTAAQ